MSHIFAEYGFSKVDTRDILSWFSKKETYTWQAQKSFVLAGS